MMEAAAASIWAAVQSWRTPAILFLVLHLVIGTIAVTSKAIARSDADANHPRGADLCNKLVRSPSIVFDRLRSFKLYHPDPVADPPPPELVNAAATQVQFSRSQSDAQPASGEAQEKLAGRMKKSASVESAFSHFKAAEAVVMRQPARDRAEVRVAETVVEAGAKEVDARADDFINRFKQQLKLERLDSFLRYKEMIHRGQ